MISQEIAINNYTTLIEKLNEISNAGSNGASIVLEINPRDYMLSQIAHLVEQNNAKLLHVFTFMEEETSMLIVILKIDLEDATYVLRSLERFNYVVRSCLQKQSSDSNSETLCKRLDELMYYLEM
ncbi:MAG: hypothetical protein LBH32_09890 [Dysgonamonadaceae bacterium]|jgi:hypothetical protein|nr:hypothetical protein [Dysgonamonadaceae bacterium]